jgi:putative flippase GtrA
MSAAVRFVVAGAANTAVTYLWYVFLLLWLPVVLAYTVAFVSGIGISYVLNRNFVFKVAGSSSALAWFGATYAATYLIGLAVTLALTPTVGPQLAAAGALFVTVPISYLATRRILSQK